jgi:hypothetical protein
MATPSRFISQLGEKGLPFFRLLKAKEKFEWSEEANTAFAELKQLLTSPPILTVPKEGETLLLYIAATNQVVSTAIVIEREEVGHMYKVQLPVYFISEVVNESKTRYSQVQKLLYAILITSRKLCHYFDTYPSKWSLSFRWGISCTIKTPTGASSNGRWSLAHIRWNFKAVLRSSHRRWSTSLSNGQT